MVVLGRVTAPFGVRGWVKIQPFGDDPLAWCALPQWWLGSREDAPEGEWRTVDLAECRAHGKGLIAMLAGVADRNAAEALAGLYVGAPRSALPEPDEGEYYWADLIGLEVVNLAGETLGRVERLISTGAHDVLCVRDEQGAERLLPCVGAVVKEVEAAAGRMRVDWGSDW